MSFPTLINPNGFELLEDEIQERDLVDFDFKQPLCLVPWKSLAYTHKLHELESLLPKDRRHATILRWSWDFHIIRNEIIRLGFKKVFCTSPSRENFGFEQISYPDYARPDFFCNNNKDIWFSFVGWGSHPVRNRIFDLYSSNPSVIKRNRFFQVERNMEHAAQYKDILSKSRFSLCPRGIGSGTIRFWESLRAGAIPVVISDEWKAPQGWDWANTIIRIREWQVYQFLYKIDSAMRIPKEQEEKMRQNCLDADRFFRSPSKLAAYINSNL